MEPIDTMQLVEVETPEIIRPSLTPEGEIWFSVVAPTLDGLVYATRHEINNPLAVIKGNLQFAQEDLQGNKEFAETSTDLAGSERSTDRIEEVMKRLEIFSRTCALSGYRFKEVDADQFKKALLPEPDGVLFEITPDSTGRVLADGEILSLAVAGLVKNSQEADASEIRIRIGQEDDKMKVDILDNGSGLKLEAGEKPFTFKGSTKARKDTSSKELSTGLVLAKTVVLAHGGSIGIENREGEKGTVVHMEFPLIG